MLSKESTYAILHDYLCDETQNTFEVSDCQGKEGNPFRPTVLWNGKRANMYCVLTPESMTDTQGKQVFPAAELLKKKKKKIRGTWQKRALSEVIDSVLLQPF